MKATLNPRLWQWQSVEVEPGLAFEQGVVVELSDKDFERLAKVKVEYHGAQVQAVVTAHETKAEKATEAEGAAVTQ